MIEDLELRSNSMQVLTNRDVIMVSGGCHVDPSWHCCGPSDICDISSSTQDHGASPAGFSGYRAMSITSGVYANYRLSGAILSL